MADAIQEKYSLSECHASRIVSQQLSMQRYVPALEADEGALTRAIDAPASEYGRNRYRRVTALQQTAGWQVGSGQ